MGKESTGRRGDETRVTGKVPIYESSSPRRPCMVMIAGPMLGEIYVVPPTGSLLVGREPESQLRLAEDESVSRRHARIERSGSLVKVVDLNSQNGTWVNGQRVSEVVLAEGQKVRLGQNVVLRFELYDH